MIDKERHCELPAAGLALPSAALPFVAPGKLHRPRSRAVVAKLRRISQSPCKVSPQSPKAPLADLWTENSWVPTHGSGKIAALVSVAQDANEEYRSYMEDGYTVRDPLPLEGARQSEQWGFFAVYDGHGGAKVMKFCEEELHNYVTAELGKVACADHNGVRGALTEAFRKTDAEVEKLGLQRGGSTATVALARRLPKGGVELHVGNVGDSRALLVGASGTRRLSTEHRTTETSELLRIESAGGFVYNRRVGGTLSVTRAFGDHYLKPSVSCDPDVCTHGVSPGETVALVIASDGLWDSVEDDEVEEVLTQSLAEATAAKANGGAGQAGVIDKLRENAGKALVEKAKARGSRDNITVLVSFF